MTNATLLESVVDAVVTAQRGSVHTLPELIDEDGHQPTRRHLVRVLNEVIGQQPITDLSEVRDHTGQPVNPLLIEPLLRHARGSRQFLLVAYLVNVRGEKILVANDRRGSRWWVSLSQNGGLEPALQELWDYLGGEVLLVPHGELRELFTLVALPEGLSVADFLFPPLTYRPQISSRKPQGDDHRHLEQLEAESIRIIREAVASARNPGMLFSMGKDSTVMWTIAKKAFWPEPPPFPLIFVDTRWEHRDLYVFRDFMANQPDTEVVSYTNPDAIRDDVNPFDHGSARHTEITKTIALKQLLDLKHFDFVFGGARRDEERSRAKERVFSLRNEKHGWDPKAQRPELWNIYNTTLTKGQSMRVFPLSNWTELDVWRYIERENIPVVSLYFSKVRPFVERGGALLMVDDERFRLEPGEKVRFEPIRFRTLGCYPLTGAVRSEAKTVRDIIDELERSRVSERAGRLIDFDAGASMEQKKKEGYF